MAGDGKDTGVAIPRTQDFYGIPKSSQVIQMAPESLPDGLESRKVAASSHLNLYTGEARVNNRLVNRRPSMDFCWTMGVFETPLVIPPVYSHAQPLPFQLIPFVASSSTLFFKYPSQQSPSPFSSSTYPPFALRCFLLHR